MMLNNEACSARTYGERNQNNGDGEDENRNRKEDSRPYERILTQRPEGFRPVQPFMNSCCASTTWAGARALMVCRRDQTKTDSGGS